MIIWLLKYGEAQYRGKGYGLEVSITQNLNGRWRAGVWLGNWHMQYDGDYSELRHAVTGVNRFLWRLVVGNVRVSL